MAEKGQAAGGKEVVNKIKFQAPAGAANPSPPIGPALGQHGLNIMNFCNEFNERTGDMEKGLMLPVQLSVYADRSFDFVIKQPSAALLLRKAVGIEKGSGTPNKDKVASITRAQLEEVAKLKMVDMNAHDVDAAVKVLSGTARSSGIDVQD
jgi:large subunit ribosomal protein L11